MSEQPRTYNNDIARAMQAVIAARAELLVAAHDSESAKAKLTRSEAEFSQAMKTLGAFAGKLAPDVIVVSPDGRFGYRRGMPGDTHLYRLISCEAFSRLHSAEPDSPSPLSHEKE